MGISWMGLGADGTTARVLDPIDEQHPEWSDGGQPEQPVLVLAHGGDSGDGVAIEGTLDELSQLAESIQREVRAARQRALGNGPIKGERDVTIEGPGGVRYEIPISGDETVTALVDGKPAVGIDVGGLGYWPDGETWQRLGVTTADEPQQPTISPDHGEYVDDHNEAAN